jgi:hypothetical protein
MAMASPTHHHANFAIDVLLACRHDGRVLEVSNDNRATLPDLALKGRRSDMLGAIFQFADVIYHRCRRLLVRFSDRKSRVET